MNRSLVIGTLAACLGSASLHASPTVSGTTFLGTLTGPGATLHASNLSPFKIDYYGTDLGLSYGFTNNSIQFLFGDSYRPTGNPSGSTLAEIRTDYDDVFGTIDGNVYNTPQNFSTSMTPLIKLGQDTNSVNAQEQILGTGGAVLLDGLKTPVGAFSNGINEYAVFLTSKPAACSTNSDCTSISSGLTCDTQLGFFGATASNPAGFTGVCIDGTFGCLNDTGDVGGIPIPGTGFCRDTTSSVFANTTGGRQAAVAFKMHVGMRNATTPKQYSDSQAFLSNKFYNQAVATVQSFIPANGGSYLNQSYGVATATGSNRKVFVWGRGSFVGVGAKSRPANVYFAYVDMPSGSSFAWTMNYYKGSSGGIPSFSTDQSQAVALDLSGPAGQTTKEVHDVVHQMSVVWVDQLKKWVMFYGGGITKVPNPLYINCGWAELFTGPDCSSVNPENGAIRMRTADSPWGPWTTPVDVLVGGDPNVTPVQAQYAAGGVLHHPNCSGATCAAHSPVPAYSANEFGFLYGANIIQPWIRTSGTGVDVIWNASTWDPYRVVLYRTHINP